MNLSLIQTELVACALCEADGQNPDADVVIAEGSIRAKAWQAYEEEARRFIVASRALEKWTRTLGMFRGLAPQNEVSGRA